MWRRIAVFGAVLLVAAAAAAGSASSAKVDTGKASAEVIWDSWGVPHIYADDYESLSYAYGYAQARDHGPLFLRFVGVSRGRAAEYWGSNWTRIDIGTWSTRIPQYATELYYEQAEESVVYCEAFAAGVNKFIEDYPEEYAGTQWADVLPVTGWDVFANGLRVYYSFSYGGASSITSEFMEANPGKDTFKEKHESETKHHSAYVDYSTRFGETPKELHHLIGSNGWAINAPKTAPGIKSLLDMNPHLPYVGFFRWYEAHFYVASVDLDLYGTGFVGLPNLQIAFNDWVGWTHTVNVIQPYAVYRLEMTGEDTYIYDDEELTLGREEQSFLVLQEDGSYEEHIVVIESSVHGLIEGRGEGYALAARLAGIDRPNPIKQWWDMGRARSMDEFLEAVDQLQISMFTIIAASSEGDILHLFNGFVPVREVGDYNYWRQAVNGTTSDLLWTELHPVSELPQILNPPEGWLSNANEPPWTTTFPLYQPGVNPDDFPAYVTRPPSMGYRPQAACRLLYTNENITYEEFIELKHSTHKEFALHIVPDLIAAIETYAPDDRDLSIVADLFREWDYTYDAQHAAALIFHFYEMVAPGSGSLYVNQWTDQDPLDTPNTLANPEAAIEDLNEAIRRLRALGNTLSTTYGEYFWFYGNSRFSDTPIKYPGHGSSDTFRNVWWFGQVPGALGGDSFVGLVNYPEEGRVEGRTCIGYGNASPGARGAKVFGHLNDQYEIFANKELKPALRDYDAIVADSEDRVSLEYNKVN